MAIGIFFAVASLSIKEIRRTGIRHFWQRVSIPETRRRRSDHPTYLGPRLGLSLPAKGGAGAGAAGTTSFREDACSALRLPRKRSREFGVQTIGGMSECWRFASPISSQVSVHGLFLSKR
jgi:hypothetical protein